MMYSMCESFNKTCKKKKICSAYETKRIAVIALTSDFLNDF